MTWSIVGTPAKFDDGATTWETTTFTWPTVASGDLAVVARAFWENNSTGTCNTPSGGGGPAFSEQHNTVISGTGNAESRLQTWTKVCDGTETGSLTVSNSPSQNYLGTAFFFVLRGASALSVAAAPTVSTVDSSSPITAPQVNASTDDGLLLIYGNDSGQTITAPGAVTTVIEGLGGNVINSGGIYYENLSTTGNTTEHSFSWPGSDSVVIAAFRIAGVGFTGGGGTAVPVFQHNCELNNG